MPSSAVEFDLLILGGGITGAAVAREAALRGFLVALVEKGDFVSGTSSKSSKLIHGGQRYLESLEFRLVRESCRERGILLRLAPHLIRPLPFLFSVGERGAPSRPLLAAGLTLYRALSAGERTGPTTYRAKGDRLIDSEAPGLDPKGWRGAYRYYDAQADDCLLTLAFLRDAASRGARLHSYTRASKIIRGGGGRVAGALVEAENGQTRQVLSRATVGALGPWTNQLSALLDHDVAPLIRPSRGSHFFLPPGKLPVSAAVVMLDSENRRCYAIPWRGGTLLGTTDEDDARPPEEIFPTESDRRILFDAVRRFFPSSAIEIEDLSDGFAGLRPLALTGPPRASKDVSRDERIFEALPGLVVAFGGKLTTARAMGARILNRVEKILRRDFNLTRPASGESAAAPLPGGDIDDLETFRASIRERAFRRLKLSPTRADRILEREGSNAVLALAEMEAEPHLARPISEALPYTVSDLVWGVREAFAKTSDDLLTRRTALSWESPAEAENARGLAEELLRSMRPPARR
jgi:glycerol-3-phosphate dehydrogenase